MDIVSHNACTLADLSCIESFYSSSVPLTIIQCLVNQVALRFLVMHILMVSGVNSREELLLAYLEILLHLLHSMVILL
jgi:hypothetical protein